MSFTLGAIPSPEDKRDYVVAAAAVTATYPKRFMLSPLPKIKDQGPVGSCVAHECSYIVEYYNHDVCSTAFVYGFRPDEYHQGVGMVHREALNTLLKYGDPSNTECPGNIEMQPAKEYVMGPLLYEGDEQGFGFGSKRTQVWSDKLKGYMGKAAPRKINAYARVTSAESMKQALMNGWPVIFTTGVSNYNPDAKHIYRPGGCSAGYHSMTAWGWDVVDGREYFRVSNSWSTGWGDNGWCWMSAEDILKQDDAWSVADDTKPEDIRRTLKLVPKPRMCGEDVAYAQERLNKHGIVLEVDGVFGPGTDKAVKAFQSAKGLDADGVVGLDTWAALEKEPEPAPEPGPGNWIDRAEPFLKIMVGDEYIIGGQGDELTKSYLDRQRKSHPDYFTGGRYEWLVKRIENAAKLGRTLRCEDCSGLFWIIDEAIELIPGRTDSTADTLYKTYCKPIKKADVKPGDILFRADSYGKMVHMAIIGREATYEAAGTAYGVVARAETFDRATLNRVTGEVDNLKPWTHYGRLK